MMMQEVPVSVVIPVRNGAALIGEALESIVRQTWRPQEIIVVDGQSRDDSEAVVRQFENAIFLRVPEAGASDKRNIGAGHASKPYLAFLDADDLWPEARIQLQLSSLIDNPSLDLVTGSMMQFCVGASGTILPLSRPKPSHLPSVSLMRREAFWKAGPFSSRWDVGETIEWWSRAMDAGLRMKAIPDLVLMRRIHDRNLGKTAETPIRSYLNMLHGVVKRRRESGLL